MTEKLIFSTNIVGKCFLQELQWQNLKCKKCGEKLPQYPKYDNNLNEIKICENCGQKHMLIRHIKGVGNE